MIYALPASPGGRFVIEITNRVKPIGHPQPLFGLWKKLIRPVEKAENPRLGGQSPVPAAGEKYFSNLPSLPSNSLASGGESFFWVIFGQDLAYSVFTSSHFSSPGSVSGLIASAGHSGPPPPQSMPWSGWMTSMFSPS